MSLINEIYYISNNLENAFNYLVKFPNPNLVIVRYQANGFLVVNKSYAERNKMELVDATIKTKS